MIASVFRVFWRWKFFCVVSHCYLDFYQNDLTFWSQISIFPIQPDFTSQEAINTNFEDQKCGYIISFCMSLFYNNENDMVNNSVLL